MSNNSIVLCGLDETGRGSLAGPIVGCGVILSVTPLELERISSLPIKDGKLLSPHQREKIYQALVVSRSTIVSTAISAKSINQKGINWANTTLFRRIIRKTHAERYIIDGNLQLVSRNTSKHITSIIDADATIPEVILAGIAAKVIRDKMMKHYDCRYPKYQWKKNFGYGTTDHIRSIAKYGITPYHRTIFVQTALYHWKQKQNNNLQCSLSH